MNDRPKPSWSIWVAGARPRTLPAAVVPVSVGAGAAAGLDGAEVTWWRVTLALVVSLLLQVGVNYANDYSDGVRGTDDVRVGPMRLVASGAASASAVKRSALLCLGLAAFAGLALAIATTWWLLVVGAAALVAAWGYTGGPKPYGYLGLGEVFVFTFFGLVATVGTTFVAIEDVPWVAWPAAVGVGCLACALLVVNNLRDIPTDTVAGKRTLAVRMGDAITRRFYVVLVVLAAVSALVCAIDRTVAGIGVLAVILAVAPIRSVLAGAAGRDLIAVLGETGKLQLAYGLLLTVGLAVG